jgi:hypothetical protein
MSAPYVNQIEKIIEQARNKADSLAEESSSSSDSKSLRSDALQAFADALEDAINDLTAEWEIN